ncbi:MAG TPA: DUF6602 domain-containing protein, partial [Gemmata sp.]|nr:DUF6602 domain-containing protein [Gemmata sp.]
MSKARKDKNVSAKKTEVPPTPEAVSTETPTTTAPELFDLGEGVLSYYSSQAQLMLALYQNINDLLGPTNDWTHPGDHCEILFRDFLRKFLPPFLSADKGFFLGRGIFENKESHCPEIDILIHNSQEHTPIFRMGDFVIVKPQAVKGMIQIKRTLTKPQARKGILNVIKAKRHLLNEYEDSPQLWPNSLTPNVFTAVVGFDDKIGDDIEFYQNVLTGWVKK